jgi:hypothetical protein
MDKRQQKNPVASSDNWYTPQWVIDALGPFDCDPCAAPADVRPFQIASTQWTEKDNGLTKDWHGVVWMNPPYSRVLLRQFCEKMAEHGNGIALLINRQDNVLWQEVIFPTAASMIFMRNRVCFIRLTAVLVSRSSVRALWHGGMSATAVCASLALRGSMLCLICEQTKIKRI